MVKIMENPKKRNGWFGGTSTTILGHPLYETDMELSILSVVESFNLQQLPLP